MGKSNIPQQKEVIADIGLMMGPLDPQPLPNESSTPEFLPENNKEILTDKSSSYKNTTQDTASSPISVVASTSTGAGLSPFWKPSSEEQSKKLWLPSEIVSPDLDLSYLNGFSKSTVHSSYRITKKLQSPKQKNLQKISCPSSTSLVLDTTENASTLQYARKIRIFPSKEHQHIFQKCFAATRTMWNRAVEFVKQNPGTSTEFYSLAKKVMLKNSDLDRPDNSHLRWMKDVPYCTRRLIIKQLSSNYKSNFTSLDNGNIKSFDISFKTRKNPRQVFFCDRKALIFENSNFLIFKTRCENRLIIPNRRDFSWLQNQSKRDFIIRREWDRYYICFSSEYEIKYDDLPSHPHHKVSLDPGVRTFQTFYSDEGIAGKIGHSIVDTLIDLGIREDRLKAKLASQKKQLRHRTRRNMKKRCFRLRTKIKNIVNDLHWKTCHYLCSNFKYILLPSYEVQGMVQKRLPGRARKINSKTTRKMLSLSPCLFKQRLIYMSRKMGNFIYIVNEAYTTKTCGGCGKMREMGGSKKYSCSHCGFQMDRDYNGARNIFLKYL